MSEMFKSMFSEITMVQDCTIALHTSGKRTQI